MDEADGLLAEQIEYYRARAPWYDDWWTRQGQYARNDDVLDRWRRDLDAMLEDFEAWLTATRPGNVLELAAGTGEFTRRIARHADEVTAIDSSPEVFEISRTKLGADRAKVEYAVEDIFTWRPSRSYDAVVFGFWISHVPRGHWDAFWATVRAALGPDGALWFCDNAPPEHAWQAGVLSPPADPRILEGDGRIDRTIDVHERVLPDGRSFRLVKRFYEPDELERDLRARGFDVSVRTTDWAFMIGSTQA